MGVFGVVGECSCRLLLEKFFWLVGSGFWDL